MQAHVYARLLAIQQELRRELQTAVGDERVRLLDDVSLVDLYTQGYERPDSIRGHLCSLEDAIMLRFGSRIAPPSQPVWMSELGDTTVVDGVTYVLRVIDRPDGRKMPCWIDAQFQ